MSRSTSRRSVSIWRGVLAFYVTAIMLVAVLCYLALLRRSRHDFLGGRARVADVPSGPARLLPNLIAAAALTVMLVIPVGSSLLISVTRHVAAGPVPSNLTLAHFAAVLQGGGAFLSALGTSLSIAAMAALGSAVIAAAAAYVMVFSQFRLKWLIDVTCTLSLAVPGVVLGIGYIFVWNAPVVDRMGLSLYGTQAILVLAGIAGAVPMAVRILLGAMAQVPATMLSAAALQGASLPRRLTTILVPLVASVLVSATLTAFGSAVFDLAINAILRPAHLDVLPVHVARAFEQGEFGQATAATLVAGGLVVAMIALVCAGSAAVLARLMTPKRTADHA